jgi:signal transduction histidine kinase
MFSLRWKLAGAMLLVALIAVGLTAFLTNLNTTTQFRNYLQNGSQIYYRNAAKDLERYYSTRNSWAGVQNLLEDSLLDSADRLVLADADNIVVADTQNQWTGSDTAELNLSGGLELKVTGQKVGTLYTYLPALSPVIRGYMGGRGASAVSGAVVSAETTFLQKVNRYLWIAGAIAFLAAIILGIVITRQITRPLRKLTVGAEQIAGGNLRYRVKVTTRDEVGALGKSFNSMAANLEKSEQSRRRLISDVTHELRTPLTIIDGTVEGILDGVFPADKEHLDTIREQSRLLTHLAADLREISLAESGQLQLQKSEIDIKELAGKKIDQFESLAAQKNIRLTLTAADNLPQIQADARRIDQVLTNLLSNALRHTPAGGRIEVAIRNDTEELTITVADNGEGIPAEHLPYIFDRFYRVADSRSRREGGAGLGLAIVKQMVEAHGGRVSVQSTPGQGTTFTVSLPVQPAA